MTKVRGAVTPFWKVPSVFNRVHLANDSRYFEGDETAQIVGDLSRRPHYVDFVQKLFPECSLDLNGGI